MPTGLFSELASRQKALKNSQEERERRQEQEKITEMRDRQSKISLRLPC